MIVTSVTEYAPGTAVEVRTRYLSSWAPGFEVASVNGDRVGVRRQSDGVVLPVTVKVDDIRLRPSDHEQP